MSPRSTPLPVKVRRIILGVITLSGLVGFASAQHFAEVVELEQVRGQQLELPFEAFDAPHSKLAAAAMLETRAQVLESMQAARVLTMLALTIASTLAFVGAFRMLRPAGASREDVRKLLTGSAVACAVLRTIDGAQMTVLARKIGIASDKVMATSDVPGGYPDGVMTVMLSATSIGMTVLVAGGFLATWMYFRSSSTRAWVAAADRAEEEGQG